MNKTKLGSAARSQGPWLLAALLSCLLALFPPSPLQRLDLTAYDSLEPLFRAEAIHSQASVIAIDDDSLSIYGRWPWKRSQYAELIERLNSESVPAIGLPILFVEEANDDPLLAAALNRSGRVVLAVAPNKSGNNMTNLLPNPTLGKAAAALGHVDVELDTDALVRRTYQQAGAGALRWEALALATLRLASTAQASTADEDHRTFAPIQKISNHQSWLRGGELLLPYPDSANAPESIPYHKLLAHPALFKRLHGKAVFIGTTASGLEAGLITPDSRQGRPMPAVEFHARTYNALASGLIYQQARAPLVVAFALAILLLAAILHRRIRKVSSSFISLAGLGVLIPLSSGYMLHQQQLWLSPTPALFSLLAGGLLWLAISQRHLERSLLRVRKDAHATLKSIADGVIRVDEQLNITLLNPVAERLIGLRQRNLAGNQLESTLQQLSNSSKEIITAVKASMAGNQTIRLPEPIDWLDSKEQLHRLRMTVTPVGDDPQSGAVIAFSDVTEVLAATARLQHEATHDLLTGLPNRTLLLDRLHQAIANAKRRSTMLAIFFVDLDRFKRINDSLGHGTGDQLLRDVAARLQASVRTGDTVSRWGGDEFVILMDNLEERGAAVTVACKILDLLDREFVVETHAGLLLSCTIGISVGPHDSDDADELILMADKAMYRGKTEGGSRYTFYSHDMNIWSRNRLELETALRHGLEHGEFELFYQPQINIANGRLTGLESLLRWHRPGVGLIKPDQFIPAAEESGFIRNLGAWVIDEAIRQNASWQREGLNTVPIAVNVSTRQCSDMAVVDNIRRALSNSSLPPSMLKVELTESTAMSSSQLTSDLLQSIHALGVKVVLDDFGTGYSSLSLLKRFPISELKIDRSFVHDVERNHDDNAIVRGTIALARSLGIGVIAEGVETQSQLRFLARHDCNIAQGFLFAQALPATEAARWLQLMPPHASRVLHRTGPWPLLEADE